MFDTLNEVYGFMDTTLQPQTGLGTFEGVTNAAANLLIALAFSISFITLAYAFIQFMMAQGDPKAIEKAQHAAMYSVAAFLVSLLAVAIKIIVYKALGATQ